MQNPANELRRIPLPRRWVNRRRVATRRAEEVLAVLHHGGGGVLLGEVRAAGYPLQARAGYGLLQPSAPLQGYPPLLLVPQDQYGPFYAPVEGLHFVFLARVVVRDLALEGLLSLRPQPGRHVGGEGLLVHRREGRVSDVGGDAPEDADVMPQTVRGRHGSCSCASQTSSGSSARTRSWPSVCGSSSSPNQTATSPPTMIGCPPVSTTTICMPLVWPGAGTSRSPGSSSSSPSTGTYRTPGASTHSRMV